MENKDFARDIGNNGERLSAEAGAYSMTHHLHRYAIAAGLCSGKIVVDVASGEGYGTHLIAQSAHHVTGIDIAEMAVKHASDKYKRKNLEFRLGSASNIPLADSSVDIVISFETIEHHDKHHEMLAEIKRILKPSGLMVLSSPDKLYYTDIPNQINPFHVKELYEEELKDLVKTYFSNMSLYGQKVVSGSLVCSLDGGPSNCRIFSGDATLVKESNHIVGSQYLICLASDVDLPTVSTSFFEGEIIDEVRREGEAVINDLKNSVSFTIGRAITAPLRWLRR